MIAVSIPVDEKRRGRPPGVTFAPAVPVRLTPEQIAAFERWMVDQPEPKPTRSEAIRFAITDWLTGLGYLPHRDHPEGAN